MMKRRTVFLLAVIFLLAIFMQANAGYYHLAQAQESQSQQLETASQQPDSVRTIVSQDSTQQRGQSKIMTFWELYQHGGNIAYIIMGVLAVGIFIIVAKAVELFIDWRNAKHLFKLPFRDLDRVKEALAKSKPSYLKEMLQHLISFFDAGYSAANTQFELNVFKHVKYEKFESYQGWLHFLSDSAGALGLLGTVWGVFLTFFGGNLDNEKILDGMGMALITTLFGLIVSLIINLGNTKIFSSFNNRMEL
ncbi:MAG: MotA/TolQ/ExbB proton channel family protein, partial [bacterium]